MRITLLNIPRVLFQKDRAISNQLFFSTDHALTENLICSNDKKSLKIAKGNQNPYIEDEQKTQWPKEIVQKDEQRSTKQHLKLKIE